jgi:AraC-like DNA-binding protein
VAAQQRHAFEARDQLVAQIFSEPESREGRVLQLRYRDEGVSSPSQGMLDQEIAALATAYRAREDAARLIALAQSVISALAGTSPAPEALDSRIELALQLVRERMGDRVQLGKIAGAVHLSPERFRHLFVEQTGVRFRAYILWLRLECALGAYTAGKSLTEAAHAGGFADSAHLSRTFRKMFGISAASIFLE